MAQARLQSRIRSPRDSWSAGARWERLWPGEKDNEFFFVLAVHCNKTKKK